MEHTLRFVVEKLRTPIYKRIANNFVQALKDKGHEVHVLDPEASETMASFLDEIDRISPDYLLLTSPRSVLTTLHPALGTAPFELIQAKLLFIHHDSCFAHLVEVRSIALLIGAYIRTSHRSHHFCLEERDIRDLHILGIDHASFIHHATEFDWPVQNDIATEGVSFVGHCVPELGDACKEVPFAHRIQADFWKRMTDMTYAIEPSAQTFALSVSKAYHDKVEWQLQKSLYLGAVHLFSQEFRGELLQRILGHTVTIYGGDPAYLHGSDVDRRLPADRFNYKPPTSSASESTHIYRHARVSLNITALQFDHTVVNRVIDCAGAGGFPLTDHRPGLEQLTSVAREVAYRSPEELNHKLDYFLHDDHQRERQEIVAALQQDIKTSCSYHDLVDKIIAQALTSLNSSSTRTSRPLQVDLGCGGSKPLGFVGVDCSSMPGVDIVADLQQPFPFSDDSVDVVRAHDTIEHLSDRIHTMNEIWRICRHGALVDLRVPSTDGRGAFQDPTHISYWNINSFKYYTDDYPEYLNLCRRYGFRGCFHLLGLSEEHSDDGVVHVHATLQAIKADHQITDLDSLYQRHDLRKINIIVSSDTSWSPEETEQLFAELGQLIIKASEHPKGGEACLLIEAGDQAIEEAGALLTSLMLQLIERGFDAPANRCPGLSILARGDRHERSLLLPLVQGRVDLSQDPLAALELLLNRLPTDGSS